MLFFQSPSLYNPQGLCIRVVSYLDILACREVIHYLFLTITRKVAHLHPELSPEFLFCNSSCL